ncbi:MAG: hypothetical protein AAFY71_01540 [Bacteroidota bacterium]
MKNLIVVCSLLGISMGLFAQSPSGKWSINMGYDHAQINDPFSSPLMYRAHAIKVGTHYQKESDVFTSFDFALSIGNSQPVNIGQRTATIIEDPDIYGERESFDVSVNPLLSFVRARASYGIGWEIAPHHFLGAALKAEHTYTGIRLDDWFYTEAGLSAMYHGSFDVGAGNLDLDVQLPLLAFVVRPNYSSDAYLPELSSYYLTYVKTAGKVVGLHQLQHPDIRLTYHPSGNFSVGYHGEYLRYQEPGPVRLLSNQVFIQYNF